MIDCFWPKNSNRPISQPAFEFLGAGWGFDGRYPVLVTRLWQLPFTLAKKGCQCSVFVLNDVSPGEWYIEDAKREAAPLWRKPEYRMITNWVYYGRRKGWEGFWFWFGGSPGTVHSFLLLSSWFPGNQRFSATRTHLIELSPFTPLHFSTFTPLHLSPPVLLPAASPVPPVPALPSPLPAKGQCAFPAVRK